MSDQSLSNYVALIRGINVGQSKRVSQSDIVAAFEEAGCSEIVTLGQSGNVVFRAGSTPHHGFAQRIGSELRARTEVEAEIVVLTADQFHAVAEANPLSTLYDDDSKLVITFLDHPLQPALQLPAEAELAPEVVRLGAHAVYQWCPLGVHRTVLPRTFWREIGPVATVRNLRTVDRIRTELFRRESDQHLSL